jgi:small conductance mechanosensitive channel
MKQLWNYFDLSVDNFLRYLPALVGGMVCFIFTIIVANFFSKISSRYTLKRSKDSLIANFMGKIVWSVIFILGTVLSLGILGLGTISNKILAGAGITTFVIGFALKDIGENFLSGIILAFSRPYRTGSFIECGDVKGIVKDMTMRQTTVETSTGQVIMIPNSMILKNPLIKYLNDYNNLRQEFTIHVDSNYVSEAIDLISKAIYAFTYVTTEKNNPVKVIVDSITGDKVKLLVIYWLDPKKFSGSRSGSRSEVIISIMKALKGADIKFSG